MAFQRLKPPARHAPAHQRRLILLSKLKPLALYGAQLLFNESEHCIKRLESVLMRLYKWIYNRNTFKVKSKDIISDIHVDEPSQTLLKVNTKFICKIMHENKVDQLLNLFIKNRHLGSKVYLADPQKDQSKSAIIRRVKLYNALPLDIKSLNPQRLKRKLKKHKVTFKD